MKAEPPLARCPECRSTEPSLIAPLFVVTGASGSGKSTVFPILSQLLPECAVFDVDWLIDPLKRITPDQGVDWENFRDAWLSVAHGVAQSGRPTLLLGPVFAEQLDASPTRRWIGDIHYAVLDCSDATRTARLQARPTWRARQIEENVSFARYLREHTELIVSTDELDPMQSALELAEWVRHTLRDAPSARQSSS